MISPKEDIDFKPDNTGLLQNSQSKILRLFQEAQVKSSEFPALGLFSQYEKHI